MRGLLAKAFAVCAFLQLGARLAAAWDYETHRLINQLALASLPTNFPAFIRESAVAERIAFLAGEPDRWRNVQDLALRHANGPDHYLDLEELASYGLKPEMLPPLRYDFIALLSLQRQGHPERFPSVSTAGNEDHTRELVGLLPWAMTESYAKLKSCFATLQTFQGAGGTPEEVTNAQADVVYVMGTMGHCFGDAAQPLHTTIHHHGWVGSNPHGYSTSRGIHRWVDGDYFRKIGLPALETLQTRLRPAGLVSFKGHPAQAAEIFPAVVAFIVDQNRMVEPLYQLDKAAKLSGEGATGLAGKAFLEEQLLRASQFLGDVWFTAWQQAPPDSVLKGELTRRKRQPKDS
jgi:hypothetical protein